MSKIPENILQAGCTAYADTFLHGSGSLGDGIEAAYLAIHEHDDWVRAGPPAWTGEGLPPVGTVCETNVDGTWEESTVLAHHREMAIVFRYSLEHEAHMYDPVGESQVRLIRTPELIAAEERAATIEQMILIDEKGSLSRTHFCGLLYDAGYRKQPSP